MTFDTAQFRPIRHLSLYEIGRTLDFIDGGRKHYGIELADIRTESARTLGGEIVSSEVTINDVNGSEIVLTDDAQWRVHTEEDSCRP